MSRYVLLFLLNIPFVLLGLLNCIVSYKLKNISRRKFVFQVMLLFIVGFGLVFASSLYSYLFNHNLTVSEPLSLFDVVQITAIIYLLFAYAKVQMKSEKIEQRVERLHQEISIKLSED